MSDKTIVITRQDSENLFMSGLNCEEAAALALAKMQGVESSAVPSIAFCFGGGMAFTGGPCGALALPDKLSNWLHRSF